MSHRLTIRLPPIAAATSAVVAFFAAAVLPAAAWPVVDGDTWWHIRAGQEVLATGAIPRVDTWSIVGAGQPWTSQDWLANVLLAIGYGSGPWGTAGLSLLFAACTVVAFWILWRAMALRTPTIGWISRVAWLGVGLVLASTVLGVRVQVLDLLMTAIVVWICWRYIVDPRRRWVAVLPVIAIVWANIHAGWILLFLLGGSVLVGEGIDRFLLRSVGGRSPLEWGQLRDLAIGLMASAVALVANPNGIDLYRYPFDTVGITALNRYILEWYPATLDAIPGQLLLGFTVVAVLPTLLFGQRRLRTADALILIGLTVMAFQAIRFLLIVGPVGSAIVAVALAPAISATGPGRRLSVLFQDLAVAQRGVRGLVNFALILVVLVLGTAVAIGKTLPAAQERAIAQSLPVGAANWLEHHDVEGRMFNRYEWGGYLGQQRPDVPIFMDGRADVYGDDLLQMYVSIITLETDSQDLLDDYAIDFAVYPAATPLGEWFEASPAWRRVYSDSLATIWKRS